MTQRMILLALCLLLAFSAAWAEDTGRVADSADQIEAVAVLEEGMTPVDAGMLKEGTWPVTAMSSSSMFKIASAEVTCAGGSLTVRLTFASDSYEYLYPGTAEEAAAAPHEALIAAEALPEGGTAFELPISALDAEVPCAAFSRRKQQWYPRTLLFRADSLPEEAFPEGAAVTAETLGLADGQYRIRAELTGGSGKTQLENPTLLTVENGQARATIVFNTKRIDGLKLEDTAYAPLEGVENAAFEIPVSVFDREIAILVNSTAMKPAVEVAYTVRFDSGSIEP